MYHSVGFGAFGCVHYVYLLEIKYVATIISYSFSILNYKLF
jgi:hypothetical protein